MCLYVSKVPESPSQSDMGDKSGSYFTPKSKERNKKAYCAKPLV